MPVDKKHTHMMYTQNMAGNRNNIVNSQECGKYNIKIVEIVT